MKVSPTQFLSVFGILSTSTSAIPLLWPAKSIDIRAAQPQPQPQQSYSVVAVDGSSTTTGASGVDAATKTVTDAVTSIRTATVLSTVVATASDAPAGSPASIVSQTITFGTTVTQAPATVTYEPSVTMVPYDDGQWHTTYYFKSTVAAAATAGAGDVAVASSSPSPTPTTAAAAEDLGQWAYWAQKDARHASSA